MILYNFLIVIFRLKGSESEKLLIIVSDGRGIFSKGRAQVAEAIKKAKSMGIFIILIIVDNPKAEKSIKDIKVFFVRSVCPGKMDGPN